MGKKIVLTPSILRILQKMGEQIKLARLRRNIPVEVIADRAGLGRTTVWSVEKGSPSVSMGAYAKVLHAIEGMDKDLLLICQDDKKGRLMQDLGLTVARRAPKRQHNEQ
ncbi:MAG TPA: transcriptional regulator [Succinivibrionaceae bacterium]|nr:transcriptional regulator [Succinivibrionaceae bacterium]